MQAAAAAAAAASEDKENEEEEDVTAATAADDVDDADNKTQQQKQQVLPAVLYAFALMLFLLSLPASYWTSRVQRAPLPLWPSDLELAVRGNSGGSIGIKNYNVSRTAAWRSQHLVVHIICEELGVSCASEHALQQLPAQIQRAIYALRHRQRDDNDDEDDDDSMLLTAVPVNVAVMQSQDAAFVRAFAALPQESAAAAAAAAQDAFFYEHLRDDTRQLAQAKHIFIMSTNNNNNNNNNDNDDDNMKLRWTLGEHEHAWMHASLPAALPRIVPLFAPLLEVIMTGTVRGSSSSSSSEATGYRNSAVALPAAPHYTLAFSLMNGGTARRFSWELQRAYALYLAPFMHRVASVLPVSVESQVTFLSKLTSDDVLYDAAHEHHYITPRHLNNVIGETSRYLRSDLLPKASLEFVVFVPAVAQTPLVVKKKKKKKKKKNCAVSSTSVLVPQWGTITILNAGVDNHTTTTTYSTIRAESLQPVFAAMLRQLRVMLRIEPEKEQGVVVDDGLTILRSSAAITGWELSRLLRQRVQLHLEDALEALRALYDVLDRMAHMPVAQRIATRVAAALDAIDDAIRSATQRDFERSAAASVRALDAAQRALNDESLLPLLYFPDEHLYAVYTPFFVPVGIPIVAALLKLWFSKKQKVQ
jgi:phosphatidylinositol glycan class S